MIFKKLTFETKIYKRILFTDTSDNIAHDQALNLT